MFLEFISRGIPRPGCVVFFLACALPLAVHSRSMETPETLHIARVVPSTVPTTKAPDEDSEHYRTLEGTHFEYRCYVPYMLPTKQAAVEVCEIEPVKLDIRKWPETEVIQLVTGRVAITHMDGSVHRYGAGDTFVLPQGFKGVWDQPGKLSKIVVRHPLFWKD
ncbi:cupin domain-containing protein [Variovorax paradoxus]|uniref:cupin domain-containing protein n=1 Tax=Variovorax paradoxus TaxID=34073 RepID=UPI0020A4B239|nr:cupin domain-containing protein [Variovorax paradoxus]